MMIMIRPRAISIECIRSLNIFFYQEGQTTVAYVGIVIWYKTYPKYTAWEDENNVE